MSKFLLHTSGDLDYDDGWVLWRRQDSERWYGTIIRRYETMVTVVFDEFTEEDNEGFLDPAVVLTFEWRQLQKFNSGWIIDD